jgi:hypothetical protein
MSLAFQRFFIPAVQVEVPGFVISNFDGTGLRMEWTISRDNTNKPDEGEIRIFNLAPLVSRTIHETWQVANASGLGVGMLLIFSIGWDRIPVRLFVGDVWDMLPEERTPTDVVSVFKLGDGNRAQRDQVAGRDFHAAPVEIVLEWLVQIPPSPADTGGGGLGLIFPPESKALIKAAAAEVAKLQGSNLTFGNIPKGLNIREEIDMIMDTLGLEWRVHNGAFTVMRGGIINKPGPILTPGTGLISYTPQNDGGITLTALADPAVEPGIQIQVLGNLGKPVGEISYRVTRVIFSGSTDDESVMLVTGRKSL